MDPTVQVKMETEEQQPQPQPQTQTQPQQPQPPQPQPPPQQQSQPQPQQQPEQQQPESHQQQPPPQLSQPQPTMTKSNILEAIEEFDSSIPDPVVHHFLNCAGLQTNDKRIIRLIAIAAQKLIHDIVSDSLQHCKLRGAQGKKTKERKYCLTVEDLASALAEHGIEVRRQHYFN